VFFRWAALRQGFHHVPEYYFAHGGLDRAPPRGRGGARPRHLRGACTPNLQLFNVCLRFCCDRRNLFQLAFDMFKKMCVVPTSVGCRLDIETYTILFSVVVRCPAASMVYLPTIRSLSHQMKASGVIIKGCCVARVSDGIRMWSSGFFLFLHNIFSCFDFNPFLLLILLRDMLFSIMFLSVVSISILLLFFCLYFFFNFNFIHFLL
jgi:hypothetical protein